mmetsp:Transcript_68901/g.115775  ORF Transcript_68901/g.115775 Transcript_68901/m.115775 type:complete len:262 (+) Transcript_68901:2125-2910(+)
MLSAGSGRSASPGVLRGQGIPRPLAGVFARRRRPCRPSVRICQHPPAVQSPTAEVMRRCRPVLQRMWSSQGIRKLRNPHRCRCLQVASRRQLVRLRPKGKSDYWLLPRSHSISFIWRAAEMHAPPRLLRLHESVCPRIAGPRCAPCVGCCSLVVPDASGVCPFRVCIRRHADAPAFVWPRVYVHCPSCTAFRLLLRLLGSGLPPQPLVASFACLCSRQCTGSESPKPKMPCPSLGGLPGPPPCCSSMWSGGIHSLSQGQQP